MGIMAIHKVIEIAIESVNLRTDLSLATKKETLRHLEQMKKKDVYIQWTKDKAIATLKEWEREHGRAPTVTDLAETGMPHAPTIKKLFDMSPSLALKQLFPNAVTKQRKLSNPWGFKTEEDWLNCFREQFEKHKGECIAAKKYDSLRDANTPTWETIARHLNISNWRKLMEAADVRYPHRTETTSEIHIHTVNSPSLDRFEQLNKQREAQMKELYNIAMKIKV